MSDAAYVIGKGGRRFLLAAARPCKRCGGEFRPREQDARAGRGKYCSPRCAREGTGQEARRSLDQQKIDFWAKVDRRESEDCRNFQGSIQEGGYGGAYLEGADRAHRVAYRAVIGDIPTGMDVCHHCDNRRCCNPGHLFLGTHLDNNIDMKKKGRNAFGSRNGAAKLSDSDVTAIRSDGRKGIEIAVIYGVSPALISMVRNRKLWRHVP